MNASQIEKAIDKHDDEIDKIKTGMGDIKMDLRLLLQNHNTMSKTVQEIHAMVDTINHRQTAQEARNRELETIGANVSKISSWKEEVEKRFLRMEERERTKSILYAFFVTHFWKIFPLALTVFGIVYEIFVHGNGLAKLRL